MKRNARAILLLAVLFIILAALNFAFLTDESEEEENEQTARRSSYLTTPYGSSAFYTLLAESGHEVTRLTTPYTDVEKLNRLGTLVIIAPPASNNPSVEELAHLNAWVEDGGLLIIIDREINIGFSEVRVETETGYFNQTAHPLQPSPLTRGVGQVELSKYATRVNLKGDTSTYLLGNESGAVLADVTEDNGRIILLTDPFVVANNGLTSADNARLALNLLANRPPGPIGFDEYHHGYGSSGSEGLRAYFRGTPIPWMLAQAGLVAALLVYSYGRRFTRPVPLRRERRTTNLEFVSSMANITRLAQASGLAMQNVYSEFRKRLCRHTGRPANTDNQSLAASVARRAKVDEADLLRLLDRCERVAAGEKATDEELLALVVRVRDVESKLKI